MERIPNWESQKYAFYVQTPHAAAGVLRTGWKSTPTRFVNQYSPPSDPFAMKPSRLYATLL